MLLLALLMNSRLLDVFLHLLTLLLQLLRALIFVEVVLGQLACDKVTKVATVIHFVVSYDITRSLRRDYVSNVLDALVV